jgi:hypothetical protein
MIASLQIGNLQFNNVAIFNFGNFQFWQFSILAIFNFGNFQFWQFINLKPSLHDRKLTNWQFNNLAIFNFDNFGQFWQLSVLTIFNLGYFQAKFLNGAQEEQEQQHINCMDLAIKNWKHILHHNIFNV